MQAFTLTSLTRGLRWQDALDIALLTLLFSSVYRWLRRTVALQEALGVATVLVASWIASHLGLILTCFLLGLTRNPKEFLRCPNRLLSVGHLADDLQVGPVAQCRADKTTKRREIIHYKHADQWH